jgi:hypothetical protein
MGKNSKASERPDHRIRIVTIKVTPHVKRGKPGGGGSTGPGSDGYLRLATNLLDVPAEIISLIYLYLTFRVSRIGSFGLFRGSSKPL